MGAFLTIVVIALLLAAAALHLTGRPRLAGWLLVVFPGFLCLAYLRDLCHDGDGAGFRNEIARLIAADPRPQEEKDQLAGSFNRGFDSYRLSYRICTSNARPASSCTTVCSDW